MSDVRMSALSEPERKSVDVLEASGFKALNGHRMMYDADGRVAVVLPDGRSQVHQHVGEAVRWLAANDPDDDTAEMQSGFDGPAS